MRNSRASGPSKRGTRAVRVASYAPMNRTRANLLLLVASAVAAAGIALAVVAASPSSPAAERKPLADEVARWSKYLKENPSKDEMWTELKESTSPVLARAEEAVSDGRWYLALQRLAPVSK